MKRMACNNSGWKAANQSKDWRIRKLTLVTCIEENGIPPVFCIRFHLLMLANRHAEILKYPSSSGSFPGLLVCQGGHFYVS
jgi:hypothetical protein